MRLTVRTIATALWPAVRAAARVVGALLARACDHAIEALFCRAWGLPRPPRHLGTT